MPKQINKKLIPALLAEAKKNLGKYELGEAARLAVNKLYGNSGELWGTYQHIVSERLLEAKEKGEPVFTEKQREQMVAEARLRELRMGLEEDDGSDSEKENFPVGESHRAGRR